MLRNLISLTSSPADSNLCSVVFNPTISLFPFSSPFLSSQACRLVGALPGLRAGPGKINPWVALVLGRFRVTQVCHENPKQPLLTVPACTRALHGEECGHRPLRRSSMYPSVALRVSPCTVPQSIATENLGTIRTLQGPHASQARKVW